MTRYWAPLAALVARPDLPARQLRLERVPMETEHACRLAHVAIDTVQGPEHDLALEAVTGLVEGHRRLRGNRGAQRQLQRQVFHADRRAVDQHHGALDDVLQLPNVARPA